VRVTAKQTGEANDLERRAQALYGAPREWREAAFLQERAASLRGAGDTQAFEDLRMAAHIYRAAGDLGRARSAMERAGAHAAARGDVVNAANSYVDAGLLALEQKRDDKVKGLALKAELLANSPMLDELQRATIMNRIGYSQLVMAVKQ
jgi:hypothetical protein